MRTTFSTGRHARISKAGRSQLGATAAGDHTSGTPVTNFKRSTQLYRLAMSHNPRP